MIMNRRGNIYDDDFKNIASKKHPIVSNQTFKPSKKSITKTSVFDYMSADTRTPSNLLVSNAKQDKNSEFNSVQNIAIQQLFWDMQHPANCDRSRFLILSVYHKSGIGSTLHMRAIQFMLGMDTNRIVIDDPGIVWDHTSSKKEYCFSTGFDCYFLPLTNCTISVDFKKETHRAKSFQEVYKHQKNVFVDDMKVFFDYHKKKKTQIIPKKFGSHFMKSGHWWMSQTIRYLVRPNNMSVEYIIKPSFQKVFRNNIPSGLASVFVRWGDKGREMKQLEDIETHFLPLLNHSHIRHVYVGSDSQRAIDEAISKYGQRFQLYFLNITRPYQGAGHHFAEYRNKLYTHKIVEQMKFNLMQLYLSVQADIMCGELASNWCRLEHELHDALGKSHFQYYQIGECSDKESDCIGK